MRTPWKSAALALTLALAATKAGAQERGRGSGESADTAPTTKDSRDTERAERPASDPLVAPRHGLLGAPGAALDSAGASRLGPPSDRIAMAAEIPDSWRSGDLVRSHSSADVRAARQQQAPDLEWAAQRRASPSPTSTPPSRSRPTR